MGNNNNKIYLEHAVKTAREAGDFLLKNFTNKQDISYKGRINLVTRMDEESEKMIVNSISEKFPDHSILAEEGDYDKRESPYLWIVDPLDGTTNYAHGFGFFGVSIALEYRGEIIAGVVNAPYIGELYTALRGEGSRLNGERIEVSETSELEKSLVTTGFPYDIKETGDNIENFNRFLMKTRAVRRPGSAAIDLCSVAAGKFDGFWELKLEPWDTAAGFLIVEEAGGRVTDFEGNRYSPYQKEILASNSHIHEDMRKELKNE
ncbi:MAG: inositol monophosphatase family protein [Elusimicrobiota bacterium]